MSAQGQAEADGDQRTHRAIRFIFEYDAEGLRLVSRQRVVMVVPPADALPRYDGTQGLWIELRGADDATLYCRVLHDLLRGDAEVFSDDPARSLRRVPARRPAGVFAVLVPDIEGADQLVMMGRPPGSRAREAAAAEILRLPLERPGQGEGS